MKLTEKQITERGEAVNFWVNSARRFALDHFHNLEKLQIQTKSSPMDLVSIVDKEIEISFRKFVAERFPGDSIIGEEQGSANYDPEKPCWVIDPIDGTMPYLLGMPGWGISVGLVTGGDVVFGMIDLSAKNELYTAFKGKGTFCNGKQVFIDQEARIKTKPLAAGISHRSDPGPYCKFLEKYMRAGGGFLRTGSCVDLMTYLASGRIAAYYEPHINSWDCMAGLILVREAGGTDGVTIDEKFLLEGGELLAGNKEILKEIEAILRS